jgi:ABC-type polysaccharide/polyol phosphate export permease
VATEPILASSPATRIPVLGRLWQLIRGGAHTLVLFYVNRAVSHQTMTNNYLVSVLNRLTVVVEEQQRTIAKLQAEVAALRERQE